MTRNRAIPQLSDGDKAYVRRLLIRETDDVLAFNKPSGLASQTRGNRARNLDHLLWAFARSNGKRPRLIHRLDAGTSGVVIAAKTKPAAVRLSQAFAGREVEKTYLALVEGRPDRDSGRIDAPIARIETDRGSQIIAGHDKGKRAMTRWRVQAQGRGTALLEVTPETGRMHQIRVHLAYQGWPILGDGIYGDKNSAARLMLHAQRLSVPDGAGATDVFEAPAPDGFTVD